jgi:hypothetical protein
MAYFDLLNDRRWQRNRLDVLDAAGWVCERCDSSDNSQQLHVHHRRYVPGRIRNLEPPELRKCWPK